MAARFACLVALGLTASLLLGGCGSGSDGSGLVSRPQAKDVVVVGGVGGHEDVRYDPIGQLIVESRDREIFLLERAFVGTIVVRDVAPTGGGGNQINVGVAGQVGSWEVHNDGNALWLGPGVDAGTITLLGDDNTIFVGLAATFTLDDQGAGNTVVEP